ncbi:MAG: LysE family transporter [Ignavibacteria bacterium]|nr:LysE family transporter [Ignavibacteria bacterium]
MITDAIMLFLKGLVIGFAMALPIGPVGVICVRKTLTDGRLAGMTVGLGAATADMLYGSIAAFGLTMISDTVFRERFWIQSVGGLLLLFIGVRTFMTEPKPPKASVEQENKWHSYIYILILTLTNPLTIFSFIGVFAALGLAEGLGVWSATILVTGVFAGSTLWFFVLSTGATFFRKKLDVAGLRWVNRVAGLLIIITGVIAVGTLVSYL